MNNEEMNEAHKRDYRFKGKADDAARAIRVVLGDDTSLIRLGRKELAILRAAQRRLEAISAHIVAVWD